MKKYIKMIGLLFVFVFTIVGLTSCDQTSVNVSTNDDQRKNIYNLAVESGYTGTYEEWLESIKGDYIELSVTETHIVWKYANDTAWRSLIELSKLSGLAGTPGQNGEDGKTPEFRVNDGYLEWKYTSDNTWIKLYEITTNNPVTGNPSNPDVKTVTVTYVTEFEFDEKTGEIKVIKSVEKEVPVGALIEPTDILSENEICYGWYFYDKYQDNYLPWVFNAYYVGADLTLYGVIGEKYTVTFLDENGDLYKKVDVLENTCVNQIYYEAPEGFHFVGWTENGKDLFDFGTLINSAVTLRPLLKEIGDGKLIELVYSCSPVDEEMNKQLIEDFKAARKEAGDPNTYEITFEHHGSDRVDSEVIDWGVGPDVYEFTSDKLASLYSKGALAKVSGQYKKFIDEELNYFGQVCATFNDTYYAYPYTGDNTYYLQYDSSVISAEQAKSMKGVLDAAHAAGMKVGYNLYESYWGAGAMFTFGADFDITFTEDGNIASVAADFNSEKGLKAAKAILEIINHPAFVNTAEVPNEYNKIAATIGGTWNVYPIREFYGENYACAVMPTVTVDGETRNLGAFLGGKLLGVNPQRAAGDADRLQAAHELAMFLADEQAQLRRFELAEIAPCHVKLLNDPKVLASPNVAVLSLQGGFAHAQTSVPDGVWSAPNVMVMAMINGECTLENLQTYIDAFNNTVVGNYNNPVIPEPSYNEWYVRGSMNEWSCYDEYKLEYDKTYDTCTITLYIEKGVEFKVSVEDWYYSFGMNDGNYILNYSDNISVPISGTYLITIYNVSNHSYLSMDMKLIN